MLPSLTVHSLGGPVALPVFRHPLEGGFVEAGYKPGKRNSALGNPVVSPENPGGVR